MPKDPAFLLYYQDFSFGTRFMSLAAKGAYIDMLCYLADKHTISKQHMLIICQSSESLMNEILPKLKLDSNQEYFNERLRLEVEKRKSYAESRRKNRLKPPEKPITKLKKKPKTYVPHMEDENEDVNEIEDKNPSLEKSEKPFLHLILVDWQSDADFQEVYKAWMQMIHDIHQIDWRESQHFATMREMKDYTKQECIKATLKAIQGNYKTIYPQKENGKGTTKNNSANNYGYTPEGIDDIIHN